jgi:hypothetical protein
VIFPYDMATDCGPVLFFMEIEALIAWPRDLDTRSRFLCVMAAGQAELQLARLEAARDEADAILGQHWLDAWDGMYQRSGGRRTLVAAPPIATMVEKFAGARDQATLAGRVLCTALQLAADPRTRDQASINLAKEIVYKDLPDRLPTARRMNRSPRPVDEAWARYRCVSPLAAAVTFTRDRIFGGGEERGNQFPADVTAEEMIHLGIAEATLKQLGAGMVPRGRTEPILPPDDLLPLRLMINEPDKNAATFRPDKNAVTFRPLPDGILSAVRNRQKKKKIGGLRGV